MAMIMAMMHDGNGNGNDEFEIIKNIRNFFVFV
jgi:hypothetical protein